MPGPRSERSARLVSERRCYCRCHADLHAKEVGAERTDPIGAAVACGECRWAHTPALSGRPPELEGPRRHEPDSDAWADPED